MIRLRFAFAALALLTVFAAWPLLAQGNCGGYADAAAALSSRWGEAPVGGGLDAQGNLVQVWANLDTGTWSVLVLTPGGPACLVASGDNWQAMEPPAAGVAG